MIKLLDSQWLGEVICLHIIRRYIADINMSLSLKVSDVMVGDIYVLRLLTDLSILN